VGSRGNRFVSDIFREVDEEVRREQLQKLWDKYGFLLIGLAVLIVAAVGGWRAYQYFEAKKAAEAGAAFEAAATLSKDGKHDDAEKAFGAIAQSGTASYKVLASLREAAELAGRDRKAAVAAYDAIANNASLPELQRDFASVRAGLILVDTASYDDMKQRLMPLTAVNRPFRHSARGLLALSAWHANDLEALRLWSNTILADPETPPSTRGQVQVLMALTGETKS
jgi:hypothetical protein